MAKLTEAERIRLEFLRLVGAKTLEEFNQLISECEPAIYSVEENG